jgi:hypothetical protein
MLNRFKLILLLQIMFCLCCDKNSPSESQKQPGVIKIQEIDDILPNPFKGFAPWVGSENSTYPTTLQCATYAWADIEPVKGNYNWAFLEKDWGNVTQTHRRVGFRIAAEIPGEDRSGTPQWLIDQGIKMRPYNIEGQTGLLPDYDDPKFLAAHHDFIMALGARYDQDARIAWIDIGSYGFWGEWHVWQNEKLAATQATKKAILDDYLAAFPTKPKVIAFDDDFATRYVTERGCGIRNDCLGTEDSNDWYLESLNHIDPKLNQEVWKTSIITGEFCGSESGALEGTTQRFDLNFQFIAKTHWSWIGPAGGALEPQNDEHRRNLDQLYKKLGYRFVIRSVENQPAISKGESLKMTMTVENKGVAPFYFPWPVVVYLIDAKGAVHVQETTDVDIRQWLPGVHTVPWSVSLPTSLTLQQYDIKIAIHDPLTNSPGLLFANTGKDEQGRYLVSRVEIK